MNTPIYDFALKYCNSGTLRMHMPGHKGHEFLGCERIDITEFNGADSLYEANGIIKESEDNATHLFGCDTFYSTEGSSHCIRSMLYLACVNAKKDGKRPLIIAARNAHKVFLNAAAMLDFDVLWLSPETGSTYLSCDIDAATLENTIKSADKTPAAVYITSPDYLGKTADISALSSVCKKYKIPLIVDNAHGAYLKFLSPSMHPIDLGTDMCCDSAHKTMPVLTGGAYIHISKTAPSHFTENVKNALALFGSTSPSYLILQSLDLANKYIDDGYNNKLSDFIKKVYKLKEILINSGYSLYGDEEIKITVETKKYGYSGYEFASILAEKNIMCEFYDPDFVVLMLTVETDDSGLKTLESALLSIPKKEAVTTAPPPFCKAEKVLSVRQACFCESEVIDIKNSDGRILASPSAGCPPAVPILMCGERIDKNAIRCFEYYGIKTCRVVKE